MRLFEVNRVCCGCVEGRGSLGKGWYNGSQNKYIK